MKIFPNQIEKIEDFKKEEITASSGICDILFDVSAKKIVVDNGNTVKADKKQLVQQWLFMLIHTEIDKYNVYKGTGFGLDFLYKMKGHEYYSSGFAIAQIEEELRNKIIVHPYVDEVISITVEKEFSKLIISVVLRIDDDEVNAEVNYEI